MPAPTAVEIILTDQERATLEAWTARRKTGQALAMRARIVLAAAGQLTNREIAELESVSAPTVTKWRNRFAERRLEGLLDEPRPGRPPTITDEQVEAVITKTLEGPPKNATHWSTRSMATEAGVTHPRSSTDTHLTGDFAIGATTRGGPSASASRPSAGRR